MQCLGLFLRSHPAKKHVNEEQKRQLHPREVTECLMAYGAGGPHRHEGEKEKEIEVSPDHEAIRHSHGTSDTWLPAFVVAENDADTHGH